MTLPHEQREVLDVLGDFTEDQFLQPHHAGTLLASLRQLAPAPDVDDPTQWARELGFPSLCPRRESNLDLPLRRRSSCPLDYEGVPRLTARGRSKGYRRPLGRIIRPLPGPRA
jgi:hypothetical protein